MTGFRLGQRVLVVVGDKDEFRDLSPLVGKTGTVEHLKVANRSAWVTMDEPLPVELQRFPDGDPRSRNIDLWPEDCEPAL